MTDALNVNVLVSAKEEYTHQLCYILSPLIYNGILSIFEKSKKMPKSIRGISYRNFQICLASVQNWNAVIIEQEVKRIKQVCSYLSDIVTAIFVSHVKILACVRLKGDHKSVKIKIPTMESFIHKIYILTCNKFYNNVNLINEDEEKLIYLISNIINECIRKQLPIENILHEYLFDVFNNDDDDNSSSSSASSSKEFKADDVVENEESIHSDPDSEFENEHKNIPVIPINGKVVEHKEYEPNFPEYLNQTSDAQENSENLPGNLPENLPEIPQNNSPVKQESVKERSMSPVTLFNDAKEY